MDRFEKTKNTRAASRADPTTYTQLTPESLKLAGSFEVYDEEVDKTVERVIYKDQQGNRYFEVTHAPRTQQLIARMLKGIINVADVIRVTDKTGQPDLFLSEYASKEFDLGKNIAPATINDVYADEYIFSAVFNDIDHGFYTDRVEDHAQTDLADPKKGGNVRYQDGKAYHFDFASSYLRFFSTPGTLTQTYIEEMLTIRPLEALERMVAKLDDLIKRFEGTAGKAFLRRVVDSTGAAIPELFNMEPFHTQPSVYDDPTKDGIVRIHKILIGRAREARTAVKQRLRERRRL